eukprot:sb/3474702/
MVCGTKQVTINYLEETDYRDSSRKVPGSRCGEWTRSILQVLIPSPMCSKGSLLTPQKTLNTGQRCNIFISGWAWYLRFQPEARTIMTSVVALVGVGAGIKSSWSRDKTEDTKMISVIELVGVGAKIKSLSHLVN